MVDIGLTGTAQPTVAADGPLRVAHSEAENDTWALDLPVELSRRLEDDLSVTSFPSPADALSFAWGGMAELRLTEWPTPARWAALKLSLPTHELAQASRLALEREWQVYGQLSHENVLQGFGLTQLADGRSMLVCEYLNGTDLAALLGLGVRRGAGPSETMVKAVARQALLGLAALHDAGFCHGDVGPQNFLLGQGGEGKWCDLGLSQRGTYNGPWRGNLAYCAPESLENGSHGVQADLFAWGVMVWEMLHQRRLYRRESQAATMLAIVQEPPPSVGATGEEFSLVERCLRKHPSERPANGREAADMLASGLQSGQPSASVGRWVENLAGEQLNERLRTFVRNKTQR